MLIVGDLSLAKIYEQWFVRQGLNDSGKGIITVISDKILEYSKFKALADDKINVTKNLKILYGSVEYIM